MRGRKKRCIETVVTFLIFLCIQIDNTAAKDAYYMDTTTDCGYIGVNDVGRTQTISIYAKTSDTSTSTQGSCTLNFRALDTDAKLKIDFNSYSINTCDVALYMYGDASSDSKAFRCGENPSNYFTIGRTITITLQKVKIDATQYNFKLILTAVRDVANNLPQDSNPAGTGMIIGVVGGVFGFIIIIIFCGVCCFRKYRANPSRGGFIFDHSQKKKDVNVGIVNPSMRDSPAFKKKLLTASVSDNSDDKSDSNKQNGKVTKFDASSKNLTTNASDSYNQNGQQKTVGLRPEESKSSVPIPPPYHNSWKYENKNSTGVNERSVDVDLRPKNPALNALQANSKFRDTFNKTELDAEERAKRILSTSSFEKFGEVSSPPSSTHENESHPVLLPVPKSPKGRKPKLAGIHHHPHPTSLSSEELAHIESGYAAIDDRNIQMLNDNSTSSIETVSIKVKDESMNINKSTTHSLKPERNKPVKGDKRQKQSLSSFVDSSPKASHKQAKEAMYPHAASSGRDDIASVDDPLDRNHLRMQKHKIITGGKRDLNASFDKMGAARNSKRGGRKSPRPGRNSGRGFSHRRGRSEENVERRPSSPASSYSSMEDLQSLPPLKRAGSRSSVYSSRSSLYDRRGRFRKRPDSVASYVRDDLSIAQHSNRGYVSDEDSDGYVKPVSRRNRDRIYRSENDLARKMREISTQTLRETATQTGPNGSVTVQQTQLVKKKKKSKSVSSYGTQTPVKADKKPRTKSVDKLAEDSTDASKTKTKRSKSASALITETKDLKKEKTKPEVKPAPTQLVSGDPQLHMNTQTAQQENKANPNAYVSTLQNEGFAMPQQQYMQQSYPPIAPPPEHSGHTLSTGQYTIPILAGYTAFPAPMPLQQPTVIVKGNISQLAQRQQRKSNWELLCEVADHDYSRDHINVMGSSNSSVFANNPATAPGYVLPPAGNQNFYSNQPQFIPPQTPVQAHYENVESEVKNVPVNNLNEIQNANARMQSSWATLKDMTSSQNDKYNQVMKTNSRNESTV